MAPSSASLAVLELAILSRRLRRTVLDMAFRSKSGHVGSAFSVLDILITLYCNVLRLDPALPRHPDRDRCILSKGHAAMALYAVLAERGFFPREELEKYLHDGGRLPGHPSPELPGVEAATGSLGHGLGIGAGMALAAKRDGRSHRVFVVLSDGECDEGSVWEAALFAAHWKLDNLTCIIDRNQIQSFGKTEDVLRLEPLDEKWQAFGWEARRVDGHDHAKLASSLTDERRRKNAPLVVIADTVKGKGVSFMENTVDWHYWTPEQSHYDKALPELS